MAKLSSIHHWGDEEEEVFFILFGTFRNDFYSIICGDEIDPLCDRGSTFNFLAISGRSSIEFIIAIQSSPASVLPS